MVPAKLDDLALAKERLDVAGLSADEAESLVESACAAQPCGEPQCAHARRAQASLPRCARTRRRP